MALTAGAKGFMVVVILGAVAFGVTKYRSSLTQSLGNGADSTAAVTVDTITSAPNATVQVPQTKQIDPETVTTKKVESAPVKTQAKQEEPKKVVKHEAAPKHKAKASTESHDDTKSNNVIPNF